MDNPPIQVPSLTSTNNFINFCVDSTLTNGKPSQQSTCNSAPMGHIPSRQNIPSTRIRGPRNGDVFLENMSISVTLATNNLATGNAVNPDTNYLAAPQQLDSNGLVLGHYHLIVDALESFGQASPTDPTKPIFSAELGTPTQSLSTTISLPIGFYRISAIAHAANHQPVIPPIDQHGSLNDVVYIIVQPNPKSRRSDHQEALQDHKSAFAEDYISTSNYLRNGMTKRQDPSTSLTLDPSVISSGFSQDGINGSTGGAFTPSLTSTNNFINYCATLSAVPLTNGTQQTTDSCNPIPMGALPSSQNMVRRRSMCFKPALATEIPHSPRSNSRILHSMILSNKTLLS
ncbi:hypothetical protein BDN70DRAFT_686268 [Pholiota conissans]|uniref:Uncharacterized protein n=1 Tax=Pholiota conissans TaxID=109636 RepID=A0A9P5Z1B8_9AGAR|nr:hypothetical protein BDN70DRAFT_686268 [Pholiota conissans]